MKPLILVFLTSTALAQASPATSLSGATVGPNGKLGGFLQFTSANQWNKDISAAAVDPNSATILSPYQGGHLHHDFGNYEGEGGYGIGYYVVDTSVPNSVVWTTFNVYETPQNSELVPIPMPVNAATVLPIEGGLGCYNFGYDGVGGNDHHISILDKNTNVYYEIYSAQLCGTKWGAGNITVFDATKDMTRPLGWTSDDASGSSLMAGLVKRDEVDSGVINHAIRVTFHTTANSEQAPATHHAGDGDPAAGAIVMGERLRLQASYDISGLNAKNQVIAAAMKKYGLIVADNGGNFYFSGVNDNGWDDDCTSAGCYDLNQLNAIPASAFDVIQRGTLYNDSNIPTGTLPTVNSYTIPVSTVFQGNPATANFSTTNASFSYLEGCGFGTSASSLSFTLPTSGTCTIVSRNIYGETRGSALNLKVLIPTFVGTAHVGVQ